MSITTTTRKRLWQRCGNRCAKCRCELHEDATEFDDPSILGEECHIVGDKPSSARYDDPLPQNERDLYANLIIMCSKCHKVIDDQEKSYSVEFIRDLKSSHELWVRTTLGPGDPAKERDEIQYSNIIDEWVRLSGVDRWDVISSWMLDDGQPKMFMSDYDNLRELNSWLFSRIWPQRHPNLNASFTNFAAVLGDFMQIFAKYAELERRGGNILEVPKFYKRGGVVDGEYVLGPKFDHYVELVEDLFLELTRAANYICDRVRESISPTFRLKEGVIVVTHGLLSVTLERLEYHDVERTEQPYPGLKQFYSARETRDFHYGKGEPPP